MDNQLFRQKSLERISSPEELHDYMRVTSPRLWMLLGAIIVLLVGFIVYASTTTLENTLPIKVHVESYEGETEDGPWKYTNVYALLPLSQKDSIETGMVVRIAEETGKVYLVMTDADEDVVTALVKMDDPDNLHLPAGECDAVLVLESTTPVSFLWN